ncbi:MAG: 16S rRNA (adenine(1518)-N(6)/adenine(1519)-N(6))-dimethyltransferase RsmA [Candidatus Shikimatogenerans sp. JK-2022]|nr:16S rRNA (adenine(1518)-N(6)/adenine(1519)-N(6))-dimethyltransferase RsmA [Candidatus Shikimatogenerans bostrichidophilus]
MKKKYGQHFLINKNIISNFIKNLDKKKKFDIILEIGAGTGNLSKKIINFKKEKIFLEIDKKLIKKIKKKIKKKCLIKKKNILLYKINKKKKYYVIGNFPFYITSKLLFWFVKNNKNIVECLGTFQKEYVENLIKKKTKLSFLVHYFFKVKKIFNINKKNFKPIPKVDVTLIKLINKKKKKKINYKNLYKILKICFKFKRKILKNILKKEINLKKIKIKKKILLKRPEELKIKDFINLYNKIFLKKK